MLYNVKEKTVHSKKNVKQQSFKENNRFPLYKVAQIEECIVDYMLSEFVQEIPGDSQID